MLNKALRRFYIIVGFFLCPRFQTRAHEWLFSSEEGQWMVVESSKSARLIMVFLDASHTGVSSADIQKDLSPLVRQLAPSKIEDGAQIPFMAASDGIKHRKVVHEVTSPLTGQIIVDDVAYEKVDGQLGQLSLSKDLLFRRLTFERSEGLIQSEALLIDESSQNKENKRSNSSKSKKKGTQKSNGSHVSVINDGSNYQNVDHGYLASSYHSGIISGFMLISSYLERMTSSGETVRAVVIGLGAGLLPMFLHGCIPFFKVEAAELDPVVVDIARDYFGFREDDRLKVHVTDGIKFVENEEGMDILIVDVDSPDSSSGMTCPAPAFVQESFLSIIKSSLSKEGLFVINLVSRSPAVKDMVVSRMKVVFSKLFSLQLEEDVNEVIFGLNSEDSIDLNSPEARNRLQKLLDVKNPEMSRSIMDSAMKIKPLDS